jgi:hypothetical protein
LTGNPQHIYEATRGGTDEGSEERRALLSSLLLQSRPHNKEEK